MYLCLLSKEEYVSQSSRMLLISVTRLNDLVKPLGDTSVKSCKLLLDVWKDTFVLGVDLLYNHKLITSIGKTVKISKTISTKFLTIIWRKLGLGRLLFGYMLSVTLLEFNYIRNFLFVFITVWIKTALINIGHSMLYENL